MSLNPALLQLATQRIFGDTVREKAAAQPPPAMGGGAPAPGGPPAPPPGPAPGGAPPPAGPDPSMFASGQGAMGGGPMGAGGMDPTAMMQMMAGNQGGGMMGGMGGGMGAPAGPQKLKPEQMMMMLDFRLYNMQQQLTAIMNQMGIQIPAGALVLPPGSPVSPPAEAALPGGPQDPTAQAGPTTGGAGQQSAIPPIDPVGGAFPTPAPAAGSGGGGVGGGGPGGASGSKSAADTSVLSGESAPRRLGSPVEATDLPPAALPKQAIAPAGNDDPLAALFRQHPVHMSVAATAAIMRSRVAAGVSR